ncbi:MAG: FIST C-terminal domain-containing protein [Rhodospirillales bacterium]|nr:FIST C-terminal domain-containing protein [Rhodospirillales bacterium]
MVELLPSEFAFGYATAAPGDVAAAGATLEEAEWGRLTIACVERLGPAASRATLGFVYVTDALAANLPGIVMLLRQTTGIKDWVGSVGVGIVAGDQEYFDAPALAVMTARLPAAGYRLMPPVNGDVDVLADMPPWGERAQPGIGVVHGDPRTPHLTDLIDGLAQKTASFLVGGLTSSRGALDQIAGQVVRGGVSGVLLGPDIAVATGLSQGCSPIGPPRRITRAEENIIAGIDDRPALDAFKEDIGEVLARRLERVAGYIHVALPVSGSDTGDYLVRNLIGIDPARGWLAIGSRVAVGDPIMFVRRDRAAAEEDLVRMLGRLRERTPGPPKAGLYFSCVARGPNLFGPGSAELAILRRELGEFPLVGMFCNGEISNNRLYGYTGVLALFV